MAVRTKEREEFLAGVIIGAVEGGTGYWAMAAGYRWSDEDPASTRVTLIEEEHGPLFNDACRAFVDTHGRKPKLDETLDWEGVHRLDIDKVATALGKISRGEVKMNSTLLGTILAANAKNDGGEIDAEGADVIAQVACFGSIVYG